MESRQRIETEITLQYVQMKHEVGRHVPVTQRAQKIADYLESKHWSNNLDVEMPYEPEIVHQNEADERPFTMEELSWSLNASKNNKQLGPDNLPMELLKWLNHDNRTVLLHMINSCIFKQGETNNIG